MCTDRLNIKLTGIHVERGTKNGAGPENSYRGGQGMETCSYKRKIIWVSKIKAGSACDSSV